MTAITIQCPQCGKKNSVPETAVGKMARCGACQHRFAIQAPATVAGAADEDYGLSPAQAAPPLPGVGRKAAWHESAPVTGGKSHGQAALEAVARQREVVRYDAEEYLRMGLILGGVGLLICTGLAGVLFWWLMGPNVFGR
jgi:hypothetical protein